MLDTAQSCEEKVIALLFGGRVPALTKLPKSCDEGMGNGNVYGEYGESSRWVVYLSFLILLYFASKILLYALQNDLFVENGPEDRSKKFD